EAGGGFKCPKSDRGWRQGTRIIGSVRRFGARIWKSGKGLGWGGGDSWEQMNKGKPRAGGPDWLTRYGYLPPPHPAQAQLQSPAKLRDAIKVMQRFAGLPETGVLDPVTVATMHKPRCSLPDLRVSGCLLSPRPPSLAPPLSRVNSFPQGSVLSQETVRTLMHHALTTWGVESGLEFQEVGSQGPMEPDILIDFARAYHQDSYPFDGQGGTLAHAFFPGEHSISGDTHFDDEETWTFGSKGDTYFFKGAHYWRFRKGSVKAEQDSPQPMGPKFLDCPAPRPPKATLKPGACDCQCEISQAAGRPSVPPLLPLLPLLFSPLPPLATRTPAWLRPRRTLLFPEYLAFPGAQPADSLQPWTRLATAAVPSCSADPASCPRVASPSPAPLSYALKSVDLRGQQTAQLGLWLEELKVTGSGEAKGQRSGRASDRRGQCQFLPVQLSPGPQRARDLGTRLTLHTQRQWSYLYGQNGKNFFRMCGWGMQEAWLLLGEAENVLAHLRRRREKDQASLSQLCLSSQHECVDDFCDDFQSQPQADTQDQLSENLLEAVDAEVHNNVRTLTKAWRPQPGSGPGAASPLGESLNSLPSLQEFTPLLGEVQQEFRCRIRRPSERLQELKWKFFVALACLRQKVAAGLQALRSAVEAIWGELKRFFFSVGQFFKSLIQV
ncbi:hypothetical protein E2I00_015732, partial [Balaenoptera physalus]